MSASADDTTASVRADTDSKPPGAFTTEHPSARTPRRCARVSRGMMAARRSSAGSRSPSAVVAARANADGTPSAEPAAAAVAADRAAANAPSANSLGSNNTGASAYGSAAYRSSGRFGRSGPIAGHGDASNEDAGLTRTRRSTRSGRARATPSEIKPPMDSPRRYTAGSAAIFDGSRVWRSDARSRTPSWAASRSRVSRVSGTSSRRSRSRSKNSTTRSTSWPKELRSSTGTLSATRSKSRARDSNCEAAANPVPSRPGTYSMSGRARSSRVGSGGRGEKNRGGPPDVAARRSSKETSSRATAPSRAKAKMSSRRDVGEAVAVDEENSSSSTVSSSTATVASGTPARRRNVRVPTSSTRDDATRARARAKRDPRASADRDRARARRQRRHLARGRLERCGRRFVGRPRELEVR